MERFPNQQENSEGTFLHSKNYSTIDESSLKQIIVSRYENMRNIEQVTGPSMRTQMIRREIEIMENQVQLWRRFGAAATDTPGLRG